MQESDWPVTSHVTSIVSHPANQMAKEGGMAVGAELKTFHMQVHLSSNENDIYSTYDPMVGLKTAAFLGSFLMAVIGYIIYKVGCRRLVFSIRARFDACLTVTRLILPRNFHQGPTFNDF